MAHHRFTRMIQRHLRDVVVVIRNADHQARALAKEPGGMLQFAEHDKSLFVVWGRDHESALMYLECVHERMICMWCSDQLSGKGLTRQSTPPLTHDDDGMTLASPASEEQTNASSQALSNLALSLNTRVNRFRL